MVILELAAENFKRIEAVEIEVKPGGGIVEIAGNNAQGKSSVLDAFMAALGGLSKSPDRPIRDGATRSTVRVELGDDTVELVVERKWTQKGSTLTVSTPDGEKHPKAQSLLNDLVGALSFDPLDFARQSPAHQAETLRNSLGIDTREIDDTYNRLFQERTEVNRDCMRLRSNLESFDIPDEDLPENELSVSELSAQLEGAMKAISRRDALQARINDGRNKVKELTDQIEKIQGWLHEVEDKLETDIEELESMSVIDIEPIREQISHAEKINARIRKRAERDSVASDLSIAVKKSRDLSDRLEALKAEKRRMLESVRLPIEGLSIDDGVVTYQGVPFSQCSSAEQLKISVAMGIAMNPKLKVILIRDGSLLDDDSMSVIRQMAESSGSQIWIERVGGGGPSAVVIEDGRVAHSDPECDRDMKAVAETKSGMLYDD